jgi:hypothetical protein
MSESQSAGKNQNSEAASAVAIQGKTVVTSSDLGLLSDVVDPAKNLDHEWDRQKSLEQRGITVITSSGTFVTLVFAISALITKLHGAKSLQPSEIVLIIVSMGLFVLAAIFGITVNKPEDYGALNRDLLKRVLAGSTDDIDDLRTQTAQAIGHARDVNGTKANRLQVAIICQVLAVLVLVAAIILIVIIGRSKGAGA